MNGFPKSSADTKLKIRLLKIPPPPHYLSLTFDFRNCILCFTLETIIINRDPSMQGRSRRRVVHVYNVIYKFYQYEFGMGISLSVK